MLRFIRAIFYTKITKAIAMITYQICMTFLGIAPIVKRIHILTFQKHYIYVFWRIKMKTYYTFIMLIYSCKLAKKSEKVFAMHKVESFS